jgi:hypothetical protein
MSKGFELVCSGLVKRRKRAASLICFLVFSGRETKQKRFFLGTDELLIFAAASSGSIRLAPGHSWLSSGKIE